MNKNKTIIFIIISILNFTSLFGQFYFGRNKINYSKFDWHVLQTENFNIYYYSGEEEIAKITKEIAEEAYDEYKVKFNIKIDRKIPLIIYSNPTHFQQTNVIMSFLPEGVGGFFEHLKGRVVLPFNGSRNDFYHVVRHELVHFFTFYKIGRTSRRIGVYDSGGFPLWFIEGIAEYWSVGYDRKAEMYVKDAILNNYLFPLNSMELYSAGFLLYKEGQSFLEYFEDNYGSDRIRQLLTDYWKYKNFTDCITNITGVSFEIIQKEWFLYLKKKYAKDIHTQNLSNSDNRKISDRNVQVSPVVFQSDSVKQLIYMSNRWGYENIMLRDMINNTEEVLVHSRKTPKLESFHLLQTRLSVNKTGELAFVSKSAGKDNIWIYDIENREYIQNICSNVFATIRSPMWSSDGKMITFSAQDTSGKSDIYIWTRNNNKIFRLTADIYCDFSPSFSPDNRYVVFSSDRSNKEIKGEMDLFLYEIETGDILQLTQSSCNETKPFWHPEKMHTIYYLSDSTGTDNLWTINFKESTPENDGDVVYNQHSDYYSFINNIFPDSDSSLILSNFSNYNFHLSKYQVDSVKNSFTGIIKKYNPVDIHTEQEELDVAEVVPYKLKYSLDIAQTMVAYDPMFGNLGGAQLGVSDMLGNRYYNFLIANTSRQRSTFMDYWNIAATVVDLRNRCDRALSVFHFANDYYSYYNGFYFERIYGIRGTLNYPINIFNRLEFSTSLWRSEREKFWEREKRFLVSNFISYVHDNSLWVVTGPIDGWRMRLSVGPSFDFTTSSISNYIFQGDFRYYWRLSRSSCFAHRTIGMINNGKDERRFYIGGSWFMRGYDMLGVRGKKYILFNNEVRLPFINSLMANFGQNHRFGFAPVRTAVFFDIGNAWDYDFPGFIGSFGVGLRGALMSQLVFRLDIGKKTDFDSIQKDLFVKFFFGWDY